MAITYVGAWRAGMDAHFLWQNADWNSFTAKWNELSGEGLRLARITTFLNGGQLRWTGVWREGLRRPLFMGRRRLERIHRQVEAIIDRGAAPGGHQALHR